MRYNFLCTVRTFLLQMLSHKRFAPFMQTVPCCFCCDCFRMFSQMQCGCRLQCKQPYRRPFQRKTTTSCRRHLPRKNLAVQMTCVFRNCRGKQIGNNDNNPRCTVSDSRHIFPYKICTGLGIIRCGTYRNNSSIMESCAFSW